MSRASLTRRGRAALVLVALTCAVAAVLAGLRAAEVPEPPRPTGVDRVGTPLWSVRRAPDLVREHAARAVLGRDLADALAGTEHCAVVADAGGELASLAPDRALAPASGMKILTGAAALDVLGPEHRFVTVAGVTAPIVDGTVDGDLVVVGGGDPTIGTAAHAAYLAERPRYAGFPVTPLEALADAIAAAGVRRVTGQVVGDDTRHETVRFLPTWKPNYRTDGEVGPLGALVVNGGFTAVGGRVPADDPAAHFAQLLASALAGRGVTTGGARPGRAPRELVEVARVESSPLAEIVAAAISASDNLTFELLVREIRLAHAGAGTTAAGTLAIEERLAALGVPAGGVDVVDGSGLSPSNRVTCDALAATVALGSRPGLAALHDGLSVAGVSGTMALTFAGHPLAGVLRAKTGQIDGVVALAGLVETPRRPTFAFLSNGGFSQPDGVAAQQRVASAVAAFPDAPPAGDLVPAP